jgi:hypothetical protein
MLLHATCLVCSLFGEDLETTLLQERTDPPLFMLPSASRNALGKSSFLPYLRFVIARRLLMTYIP